jgi:hypothetical protein
MVQSVYHLFQPRPFTPELLGTLRVTPDLRFLQFADDLRQAFILAIEVKDTP